ncbi:MAG: hypothetical protein Q9169_001523 [Polycauliona sp. 2 TL-2023]
MAPTIAARCQQELSPRQPTSEDDFPAELDEPPDELIHFTRVSPLRLSSTSIGQCTVPSLAQHDRKASLLTQALLTSDDSTPSSDAEAPLLISDADLTSPTRTNSPSPPPPASCSTGTSTTSPHDNLGLDAQNLPKHPNLPPATETQHSSPATDLETGLGRKRCIKFACGRQDTTRPDSAQATEPPVPNHSDAKATQSTRRPCMLRFVCPVRESSRSTKDQQSSANHPNDGSSERSSSALRQNSVLDTQPRQHRDSVSTIKAVPITNQGMTQIISSAPNPPVPTNTGGAGSEALRFHEFAGPYSAEDEWIHEHPVHRKKLTVNDTLRKENAIRKLGEEAEEEALEEEDAEEQDERSYTELDNVDDDLFSDDSVSDAGNETDDEEGFAESDNESEMGSDYQFWTPGLTTAATSADHLEHIRPNAQRTASESSLESMIRVKDASDVMEPNCRPDRKARRTRPTKMRPGTPDLPDSTDFVCGTLDEDRPLEAAYMSCLEERRRSKRCVVPQDIDPSFPTSEPEDDRDGEISGGSRQANDELLSVMGQPDHSDEERTNFQRRPLTRRKTKSPMPSPKRLRSPPPQKRSFIHRSPPPATHRAKRSDSDSSMPSSPTDDKHWAPAQEPTSITPGRTGLPGLATGRLPQGAQLTHTASLPRTPNPFWAPCGVGHLSSSTAGSPKSRAANVCSRGPIDIVTGLEKKRQRRKEKYWRQHHRNGAKEKDRRCQPGKGAERMRELGLEMAGKNKGYLPNAQLMLSV